MPFDPYLFTRHDVLGVPVFLKRAPWVNGHMTAHVAFRVGGRLDPVGKEGLAHFFEHLPFDGCEGAPTHEAIEAIRRTLFMGSLNAWTGLEGTSFHGKFRAGRIGEAMDFLRRLIWRPLLEPSEIDRERQVIEREIWRRYGTPKDFELARMRWADTLPPGHRFATHRNVLGSPETLAGIRRDDLVAFHSASYVRESMAIFIAGDVDEAAVPAEVRALIESAPSGVRPADPAPLSGPTVPPVPVRDLSYGEFFGVSGDSLPKNTELTWERVVPLEFAPNRALRLAGYLIGQVLFDEIRGKFGATYSVSPFMHRFRDLVEVGFHTKTDPERAEEIRALAEATIARIAAADPAFAARFEEAKGASIDSLETAEFDSGDIADDAVGDWTTEGRVSTVAEELADLRAATYASTADLVRRALLPDECQRFILRP